MWLLDTQTLKLQEIVDPSTVNYAILSHTWEHDEVSFQDISDLDTARKKAGFSKISKTCELARQRSIPYAWVDTCCIDKSSSAELSEAINSMFQWYKLSVVCFVYLSDFTFDVPFSSFTTYTVEEKALNSSRWFTRGWTLQELIAPSSVTFYNTRWKALATKNELAEKLERITSIPHAVLESRQLLRTVPVAVKMSWAAHRKTKRIEDQAYSLLGIFDINMPMLYGEGSRAFRRLQEEIARETNDLSLFAWQAKERSPDGSLIASCKQEFRGILSRSPEEFVDGPKLHRNTNDEDVCDFSLANKGVRIDTTFRKGKNGIYVMNLGLSDSETGADVCISLVRTADGFVRSHPWSLFCDIDDAFPKNQAFTAYVRKDVDFDEESWIKRRLHRSFHINITLPPSLEVDFINPHPRQFWDDFFSTFIRPNPSESFGASIDIGIKGVDGGPDVRYPMRITLAWSKLTYRVHAVIHSTEHPIEDESQGEKFKTPGRRMVLGRLRDEIPSFKKDDSFGKPTTSIEDRVKSMSKNTRPHSEKVYFVDEESNEQLQDSEAKSARVTTFEISLETCSDFLFTEYYILVTGQVRVMDLATVLGTDQFRNLLALGVKDWDPYLLDLHYHSDFSGESAFEASAVGSPSSPTAEGLSAECSLTTP
ncbi:unnamed protein product [Colletotrichum noveboracense]|uniref:HET domain-containing protein n=1 Tax=Colletotrichum noveboracense TaxID=2664923 RepID=A0A9W4RHV4_9PEZI|nr:unnamed protein product [Colletotrichum noveboracense]